MFSTAIYVALVRQNVVFCGNGLKLFSLIKDDIYFAIYETPKG